jgi:acyl-CoA synthetase (AMP-forming)/AMP-acid ligase II
MTEAAHQMCSQPAAAAGAEAGLRGRARRPRGAHRPRGREPAGREGVGEVVISGPNVTPGYEGNPEANAKNFFEAEGKRWFRTGDQGAFDADGYLTLTGRLKEIINRGGEKVSPLEVDGVLMDHPAIAQVRDLRAAASQAGRGGGRGRGAARGREATRSEIRDFAAERLADSRCRARW